MPPIVTQHQYDDEIDFVDAAIIPPDQSGDASKLKKLYGYRH